MTGPLTFAKYHAAGNDFILIQDLEDAVRIDEELARALCDRWVGVGADGVIRVTTDDDAPFRMTLTNADGSAAEMSGNGMRCVAAFLHARGLADEPGLRIASAAGIREVQMQIEGGVVRSATVSMGAPSFAKSAIPMRGPAWETFLQQPFSAPGVTATASAVSMGNPHLVLFIAGDPEEIRVESVGPNLERHELFPERTNVEFARIIARDTIHVRVWERGVGETLACGTGACAVAAAAQEASLVTGEVKVKFRGGTLLVDRKADGELVLGGPVEHVFDGVVDPGELGV
jgi:diaminopimelate epimerase